MPTYAQLQAESWWGREIVTPEVKQFEGWIREHFGLPADAIGDKGNNVHLNGSHRSQEWILNSRYCTNRTYTVQQGLTAEQARHIAGVDITPNTTREMLEISQRMDRATRAGQLEEVRYWYGNVNGDTRVDGYDNIKNVAATSDSSHLWHLHLSLDRRVLRDINALRRVYAVLTGEDDDMNTAQALMLKLLYDNWSPDKKEWIAAGGNAADYDALVASGSGQNGLAQKLAEIAADAKTAATKAGGGAPTQEQVNAAVRAVLPDLARLVAAELRELRFAAPPQN